MFTFDCYLSPHTFLAIMYSFPFTFNSLLIYFQFLILLTFLLVFAICCFVSQFVNMFAFVLYIKQLYFL
jgi:hypothetical protein